jgi:predicted enzyme related to lactoylglutathione lyase
MANDAIAVASILVALRAVSYADTCVVLFTPDGHEDRVGTFVNCSLACEDVKKTYDELVARGVEFMRPPTAEPWGTYAMFRDADGNQLVLSGK